MPQIPTAKEGQRLNQSGVGAFQSSDNARMIGDDIAGLGRAVSSFAATQQKKEKDDPTLRTVWLNKVKALAEMRAAKNKTDFETKASVTDMGDKFGELYERDMGDYKVEVMDQVPEQFKTYADVVYDTTRLTNQADVFKISGKQMQRFENNAIDSSFAEIYNTVKVDPNKFKSAELDAAMLHDSLVQSGKLSPERMTDNRRAISKKLVDSAIDGWVSAPRSELDVNLFNSATTALESNKSLYTEDEFKKRMEQVDTAKNTFLTRTWTLNDRAEKEKEKAMTAKQNANLDQMITNIYADQSDPVKMNHHRQTLMDQLSQGKANYVRPQILKAIKMTDDLKEAGMSSEISAKLGTNPSKATAQEVFKSLNYSLANGDIDPETHKYWQNYTRNIMDKNKADPNYSKKLSAAKATLRAVYAVGPLDQLQDLDADVKKNYLADLAKLETIAAKSGNPDLALDNVRSTWSQKQRSVGAPANYPFSDLTGDTLRDQESLNKAINYTRDAQRSGEIDGGEFRKRMRDLHQAEKRLESQKRLDSQYYEKFKNDMTNTLPNTTIPLRSN